MTARAKGLLVVPGIRARFYSKRGSAKYVEVYHEEVNEGFFLERVPCSLKTAAEAARKVFRKAGVDGVKYPMPPSGLGQDWPEHVRTAWIEARQAARDACSAAYYKY